MKRFIQIFIFFLAIINISNVWSVGRLTLKISNDKYFRIKIKSHVTGSALGKSIEQSFVYKQGTDQLDLIAIPPFADSISSKAKSTWMKFKGQDVAESISVKGLIEFAKLKCGNFTFTWDKNDPNGLFKITPVESKNPGCPTMKIITSTLSGSQTFIADFNKPQQWNLKSQNSDLRILLNTD